MPAAHTARALQPRRTPTQSRSRETVAAILDAAARVFATQGYAAGTTNHIAAEAGVSVGSLYEYFPNKDALLAALLEEHVQAGEEILVRAAEGVGDMRGRDTTPVVRRFVEAMVTLHARDRALHRVLFEEAPLPRRIRERMASIEARATAFVEAYLRAHPGRTRRDPALAAAVAVQTIEGLTHKLVLYGERDADIDAYVEEMVALITAYWSS